MQANRETPYSEHHHAQSTVLMSFEYLVSLMFLCLFIDFNSTFIPCSFLSFPLFCFQMLLECFSVPNIKPELFSCWKSVTQTNLHCLALCNWLIKPFLNKSDRTRPARPAGWKSQSAQQLVSSADM